MKWKYAKRTVNGVKTKCKVHKKQNGSYLVRKVGVRNRHD